MYVYIYIIWIISIHVPWKAAFSSGIAQLAMFDCQQVVLQQFADQVFYLSSYQHLLAIAFPSLWNVIMPHRLENIQYNWHYCITPQTNHQCKTTQTNHQPTMSYQLDQLIKTYDG